MKTRTTPSRNLQVPFLRAALAVFLAGALTQASFAQMPGASPTPVPSIRMPQDSWYLAKQIPAGTVAKLSGPSDVSVGPDGDIYVADQGNGRIQVLDSDGTLVRSWDGNSAQVPPAGSPGMTGRYFSPRNVQVAADGKVYVLDGDSMYRARVLVFDAQGKFLRSMGQVGSQEGQFTNPRGLAVDSAGNVFVGDSDYNSNRRITMFDANGDFVRRWGSYGGSDGQFYEIQDLQTLSGGKLAVLDSSRIQIFNSDGTFDSKIDTNNGWNQYALSIDGSGDFYVFLYGGRVQKWSSTGSLLATFDLFGSIGNYSTGLAVAGNRIYIADSNHRINVVSDTGNLLANWGVQGSASTASVFGLAVDGQGNTFVAEADRNEIRKYDPQLNLLKRLGSAGSGNGEFSGLRDLAVGSNNRLYALEQGNSRVQIFDLEGNYVGKFGLAGTANGRFQVPSGIAVGKNNKVYVADRDNHRVQIFDADGNFIGKFGQEGSFDGEFKSPYDVATYPNGDIAVADHGNKRIQVFDHEGKFLRKAELNTRVTRQLFGGASSSSFYYGPTLNAAESLYVGSDALLYVSAVARDVMGYNTFYPIAVLDGQLNGIKVWPLDRGNWTSFAPGGSIAETLLGNLVVASGDGQLRVWNRTSRTVQPEPANALPLPSIVSQQRRPGTSLVDVDYTVKDADNATVHTAALAFKDGGNTLSDVIPITSLVGDSMLGANTPTGSTHRFTWDAGQDLNTDFSEVQFEILAKDARELLNLSFIQIPAIGNDPALKISISPLNDSDFLSVWYWLIATGDNGFEFSDGMVRLPGSGSPTDGLSATYYSNDNFTGEISTATGQLPSITGVWANYTYQPNLPNGTKSVRWSGFLKVDQPGNYQLTFSDYSNSQATIRVGGAVVYDGNGYGSASVYFIANSAGLLPVSIDYKLQGGGSSMGYLSLSSLVRDSDWSSSRNLTLQDYKTAPGLLATGTSTTEAGREFLFAKMGLREATAAEVLRAKEAGNPGAPINQWDPKSRVGPDERPAKINAYGFDTGGSGYWVVPVNSNN